MEGRSIALTHEQIEIKRRDLKIYAIRNEEILLHLWVAINLNNQNIYKMYISPSSTTKSLNKVPPKCHSTIQNNTQTQSNFIYLNHLKCHSTIQNDSQTQSNFIYLNHPRQPFI